MLKIKIPNNNIPEREYVIKMLLSDHLGLQYDVLADNSNPHYSLCFVGCELVIHDCFFGAYPDALSYLSADNIPGKVIYTKNEFIPENNIPIIFGSDELIVSDKKIICGIDVFASSFFMLTRWEEYKNKTRDMHNRFSGSESIAYKFNFLHRPVVNEYVEMLWNMMLKLGFKNKKRERKFKIVLTHDIDELAFRKSFRTLVGHVIKRRSVKLLWIHFKLMFLSNPYDTFDFLMKSSERIGLKSHFYFMSSDIKQLPLEHSYDIKSKLFKFIIENIKKRGHIIGFHPGYYTYDDDERWGYEKRLLDEAIKVDIVEGRQHYLRIDMMKTLIIWDKNNMKIDSTLGYADIEGFRCGTGDIFFVFDFQNRRQLKLQERPLIIMDTTLFDYQAYSFKQALKVLKYYISIGRKYNTTITLLFHNSYLFARWNGYSSLLYKRIFNE